MYAHLKKALEELSASSIKRGLKQGRNANGSSQNAELQYEEACVLLQFAKWYEEETRRRTYDRFYIHFNQPLGSFFKGRKKHVAVATEHAHALQNVVALHMAQYGQGRSTETFTNNFIGNFFIAWSSSGAPLG